MGADSERLAAIQKRLDAASDAPWEVHIEGGIDPNGEGWSAVEINFNTSDRAGPGLMMGSYEGDEDDAEFIAHCRSDVPFLLRELERAYEEIRRLKDG